MTRKKLTILHSNDMHEDFDRAMRDERAELIHRLSLLSGYISSERQDNDAVIYAVAGDMLQGNVMNPAPGTISTVEIMNYLAPDVTTLGNHEFDYGLPQLLFLEKVANFPIVNANLYIQPYHKRLMRPYHIIRRDGLAILVIGIITAQAIERIPREVGLASTLSLEQANAEIGRITNAYNTEDIDLTIILTHIGFEEDLRLAAMLDPTWGVDMIIGGHTGTVLREPAMVNDILIAQAGEGITQIGRFDLEVDDEINRIADYRWSLVPINEDTAPVDKEFPIYCESLGGEDDRRYNAIVAKLGRELTHPGRWQETTVGNLTADAIAWMTGCDVVLVGSGSIRLQRMGPLVNMSTLLSGYPFEDSLNWFTVNGELLKRIFACFMEPEVAIHRGEFYQVNSSVRARYDISVSCVTDLSVNGRRVEDEQLYSLVLQGYHVRHCQEGLGVTLEELSRVSSPRVVATSMRDVIQEYLREHQNAISRIEGRLVYEKQEQA